MFATLLFSEMHKNLIRLNVENLKLIKNTYEKF